MPRVGESITAAESGGDRQAQPRRSHGNESARSDALRDDDVLARIDDRPIAVSEFVDVLLRSHGPALLEQMIVLVAAERITTERGLHVTQADIDEEYDRALRKLIDPLTAITGRAYDRLSAEDLLVQLLEDRNVSREEYLLAIRRNALLRRLALDELRITEDDLRGEYGRVYGERVQVRHIQLSSPVEVERMLDRLREGEDFGALARRFSLNSAGALNDGLLEPFSRHDESVPEAFRAAAFSVPPGELAVPVRIGQWYHVLKVEKRIPAESPTFEEVRPLLERRLQDRLVEPRIAQLHQRLFRNARVSIQSPALREAFDKKYGRNSR